MTDLDDICQRLMERAWTARSSDGYWKSAWFFIVGSNTVISMNALFPASRYERTDEPEIVADTVRAIFAKGAVFVTDTRLQAISGALLPYYQALVLTLLDPVHGSRTWVRVYADEDGKPRILHDALQPCDERQSEVIMANEFLGPVMAALREQV